MRPETIYVLKIAVGVMTAFAWIVAFREAGWGEVGNMFVAIGVGTAGIMVVAATKDQ